MSFCSVLQLRCTRSCFFFTRRKVPTLLMCLIFVCPSYILSYLCLSSALWAIMRPTGHAASSAGGPVEQIDLGGGRSPALTGGCLLALPLTSEKLKPGQRESRPWGSCHQCRAFVAASFFLSVFAQIFLMLRWLWLCSRCEPGYGTWVRRVYFLFPCSSFFYASNQHLVSFSQ